MIREGGKKAEIYSYSANLGVKTQVSLSKTVIADTLKSLKG